MCCKYLIVIIIKWKHHWLEPCVVTMAVLTKKLHCILHRPLSQSILIHSVAIYSFIRELFHLLNSFFLYFHNIHSISAASSSIPQDLQSFHSFIVYSIASLFLQRQLLSAESSFCSIFVPQDRQVEIFNYFKDYKNRFWKPCDSRVCISFFSPLVNTNAAFPQKKSTPFT